MVVGSNPAGGAMKPKAARVYRRLFSIIREIRMQNLLKTQRSQPSLNRTLIWKLDAL